MARSIMFGVETTYKQWEKDLKRVVGGMSLAMAETLNSVGAMTHAQAIRNLRSRFTLRNKYTENSVKSWPVNATRSKGGFRDIDSMKDILGTKSWYLRAQEGGETVKPKRGSKVVPMPTRHGRPNPARPVPIRLRLGPNVGDFGGKDRNPGKFFLLPSGIYMRAGRPYSNRKGGYKRTKGVRNPRALLMVYSTKVDAQRLRQNRWLADAVDKCATSENMRTAFVQSARRILGGNYVQ